MNKLIIFSLLTIILSCQNTNNLKYPTTEKRVVIDSYFGTDIQDPYRWLEDDLSEETMDWVNNQNKTTFNYLNSIPYKKNIKKRLEQIWNYE